MARGRKKRANIAEQIETAHPESPIDGPSGEPTPPPPAQKPFVQIIDRTGAHGLPQKALFRVGEVAAYFSVTERCIWLWIEHGHLVAEKINGITRVPRESILSCRFNTKDGCNL